MIRSYKYKLTPTFKQKRLLARFFGCVRFVWNWGVGRAEGCYAMSRELTKLKAELPWLRECCDACLRESLRDLEQARRKGEPGFRSKKSCNTCRFTENISFDYGRRRVRIPKIGLVRFCGKRRAEGVIKTLTVKLDACGVYWAVAAVEEETPKTKELFNAVGIDLGIKDFAILSTGEKIGNPRYLANGKKTLDAL